MSMRSARSGAAIVNRPAQIIAQVTLDGRRYPGLMLENLIFGHEAMLPVVLTRNPLE